MYNTTVTYFERLLIAKFTAKRILTIQIFLPDITMTK